ncbi:general substrate transporter [Wallemia mellicola]|nr:general substrate transporter [Wallemia mellicola]
MTVAGAFICSIFAGALSDKIGRKWVLVISDICYCIGTVIFGASYSVAQAAVGRLVLGFGVGMSSCIGPMYISEISPPQLRGTLVTINSLAITFGQVVSYGLGAALLHAPEGWRIMLVLGAVPAIYQAIAIHLLPESPRYLLTKDKTEEAYNAIARMYPRATQEELALKFDILTANVDESVQLARQHTTWQLLKSLFTIPKNLRALSLAMTLQATQQLCGFNGLMYFAPTLFQMLGFQNPPTGGLVVAAANMVFTGLGMLLVDRVGRRPLVVFLSSPGVILGCVWSIVSLYFLTKETGLQFDDNYQYDQGKQVAVIIGFVFYVAMYGVGLGHVPWTMSDLFSLEVRGIGTGIGTSTNWATNLIISESYLSMQKGMTPSGTFGLFAGFTFCGWAYLGFCYPETTGLHLEEIQDMLRDGFNVRKSIALRNSKKRAMKAIKNTDINQIDPESK